MHKIRCFAKSNEIIRLCLYNLFVTDTILKYKQHSAHGLHNDLK